MLTLFLIIVVMVGVNIYIEMERQKIQDEQKAKQDRIKREAITLKEENHKNNLKSLDDVEI